MAEIVADEQQRHPQPFCQRIGKAIAEVQAAGMAPLAETSEGLGQQDLRARGCRHRRLHGLA